MKDTDRITDRPITSQNGFVFLFLILAGFTVSAWMLWGGFSGAFAAEDTVNINLLLGGFLLMIVALFSFKGLYIINPNESVVLQFFGNYVGTDSKTGFNFVNPFYSRLGVSRRLSNLEIKPIKVNDAAGNPIEIGAVVVYNVVDAAKSRLEVSNVGRFVHSQSESALRQIASSHAYDQAELKDLVKEAETDKADASPDKVDVVAAGKAANVSSVTLLNGGEAINQALEEELRKRFERAGVDVTEARISHLAYAPEIAGAMLRRQQADAVIAARRKIVEGAVEMTDDAINRLQRKQLDFTPTAKAALAANLLVVLVGEKEVTPVINAGTPSVVETESIVVRG